MSIVILIIIFFIVVIVFINVSPQFGEAPKGIDLERISKSKNYNEGKFVNLIETTSGNLLSALKTIPEYWKLKNGSPASIIPSYFNSAADQIMDSIATLKWYGHSTFMIQLEGKKIMIDPMLGITPTPISFGTKRFKMKEEVSDEDIDYLDFVIFSHDHYDHLDYPTICKIKDKVGHFYTPLGLGSHLKSWGVDENKITELDWWESVEIGKIKLIATPARHFSGRGISDGNKTLWAGWIINTPENNLFFSGDSGYGTHFKEIGDKYGPFDLAMMECGQYNKAWSDIHMMPEESIQAGIDLKGKLLMPIHWGAFQLSIHSWDDPIKRFVAEGKRKEIEIIHPLVGETFVLGKPLNQIEWWNNID